MEHVSCYQGGYGPCRDIDRSWEESVTFRLDFTHLAGLSRSEARAKAESMVLVRTEWAARAHPLLPCCHLSARFSNRSVTIRTYRPIFIYSSVYWYWSHSDSHPTLLPALGPITLVDSCTACCCDSELRLTVHRCALWPIVAVTLLFLWRLLFALLYCSLTVLKSGVLGTLKPQTWLLSSHCNQYFGSSQ